jgi:GGDEF domain-containing protein
MDKLRFSEDLPFTIIMGDVNGTKLANDPFGHIEDPDKPAPIPA